MKIVFFGTPDLAVPTLINLLKNHDVAAVVTKPDARSGRGGQVSFPPVKQCALQSGIQVMQPEKLSDPDFLGTLESIGADAFVVAAYAKKIPIRLLEMPKFGCINLHPSLLPKYRGAAPVRGPILNGDAKTGVTVMQMAESMDTGDILLQEEIPLTGEETTGTLTETVAAKGAEMMVMALELLEKGLITPVKQDESKASYIKMVNKEDGIIDFSKSAAEIERQIRACDPWPSAFTMFEGKSFKIWKAEAVSETDFPNGTGVAESTKTADFGQETVLADCAPGTVAASFKGGFYIKTGDGFLKPLEIQLEGKKRMETSQFLLGKKIGAGCRFGE